MGQIIWDGIVYELFRDIVDFVGGAVGGYLMSGATDCCNGVGGGGDLVQ